MLGFVWLSLCACLLIARGAPATPSVLVYTVSAGFEHDIVKRRAPEELSPAELALKAWGSESGAFQAVISRDPAAFEAESLERYAAVLFYTTGELPLDERRRAALFAFVRAGGGFVGLHSATDTLFSVEEYGRLVGARFDGHPWHQPVRVRVEDPRHASTLHFGESFQVTDEIYQFRDPFERARLHVLLSLDLASVDPQREGVHRTDGDFALAWTHPYGQGRVFYTALGHGDDAWKDPRFREHVVGGLRWAMRTTPRVELDERLAARRERALTETGDARAGRATFEKAQGAACLRCHVVGDSGGRVGPDLSAVAARLTREELVDAILTPSAGIAYGFAAVELELPGGQRVRGRVLKESEGALEILDSAGTTHTYAPTDVQSRTKLAISLMPASAAGGLTDAELVDLLAYVRTLDGTR